MLPTLALDWLASALRGKKAGRFHEVAGMSIVDAGCLVHGRHFNGRQLSGLNKNNLSDSTAE